VEVQCWRQRRLGLKKFERNAYSEHGVHASWSTSSYTLHSEFITAWWLCNPKGVLRGSFTTRTSIWGWRSGRSQRDLIARDEDWSVPGRKRPYSSGHSRIVWGRMKSEKGVTAQSNQRGQTWDWNMEYLGIGLVQLMITHKERKNCVSVLRSACPVLPNVRQEWLWLVRSDRLTESLHGHGRGDGALTQSRSKGEVREKQERV